MLIGHAFRRGGCDTRGNSGYHRRGLIRPINSDHGKYYLPDPPPILDELARDVERARDIPLLALAYLVHHLLPRVLDVRQLSLNRLRLLIHQATEFAAFARQRLDSLLHFGETDLALFDKFLHLALVLTELLGEFVGQGNTTAEELIEVLRVETALYHGRAVKKREVF